MKKRQNHKQVIKNAGYSLFRVETSKYKGLFGGTCNHVIGLQDKEGKTLCFSGEPYFPVGKASAFSALIENGDINAPAFSFKKISFQIINKA